MSQQHQQFAKIRKDFFAHPKTAGLSPMARLVHVYLIATGHWSCIRRESPKQITIGMGYGKRELDAVEAGLGELEGRGIIERDDWTDTIWLVEGFDERVSGSLSGAVRRNMTIALHRHLEDLPEGRLIDRFRARYPEWFCPYAGSQNDGGDAGSAGSVIDGSAGPDADGSAGPDAPTRGAVPGNIAGGPVPGPEPGTQRGDLAQVPSPGTQPWYLAQGPSLGSQPGDPARGPGLKNLEPRTKNLEPTSSSTPRGRAHDPPSDSEPEGDPMLADLALRCVDLAPGSKPAAWVLERRDVDGHDPRLIVSTLARYAAECERTRLAPDWPWACGSRGFASLLRTYRPPDGRPRARPGAGSPDVAQGSYEPLPRPEDGP